MIDIKELRVGSHVSFRGKMECITTIDALNEKIGINAYKEDERGVKYAFGFSLEQVEPIPITEELLEELGFVKVERLVYQRPDKKYIDAESASMKRGMYECCAPKVTLTYWSEIWCVTATNGQGLSSKTFVRHLHELENFVYLVMKEDIEKINGK